LTFQNIKKKLIRNLEERKKKLTAVSHTVWVDLKAMVSEKTIKQESTNKIYFNDNYSAPFA
jgi:hypothetical protein